MVFSNLEKLQVLSLFLNVYYLKKEKKKRLMHWFQQMLTIARLGQTKAKNPELRLSLPHV